MKRRNFLKSLPALSSLFLLKPKINNDKKKSESSSDSSFSCTSTDFQDDLIDGVINEWKIGAFEIVRVGKGFEYETISDWEKAIELRELNHALS